MTPRPSLELLGFYPGREPCLAVRVFGRRELPLAYETARQWFAEGHGDCARVQLSHRLADRRRILLDYRALQLGPAITLALGFETHAGLPRRRRKSARNHAW